MSNVLVAESGRRVPQVRRLDVDEYALKSTFCIQVDLESSLSAFSKRLKYEDRSEERFSMIVEGIDVDVYPRYIPIAAVLSRSVF